MATSRKALVAWSSGKDSAFALEEARRDAGLEVVGLFTTFHAERARVSMHGVRRSLVLAQAVAAGLPLLEIPLPTPCPNAVYEESMRGLVAEAKAAGVEAMVFGDLFLEDIRRYREQQLAGSGIEPVFPLWGRDTAELAEAMWAAGIEAWITCVDPRQAPRALAGRRWDRDAVAELPPGADPCGERGEFHTCVVAAPGLSRRLAVQVGPVEERDGFVHADLVPAP